MHLPWSSLQCVIYTYLTPLIPPPLLGYDSSVNHITPSSMSRVQLSNHHYLTVAVHPIPVRTSPHRVWRACRGALSHLYLPSNTC